MASSSFPVTDSEDAIYKELWHACAGPLVTVPRQGELVFYFPQGHIEQVNYGNFMHGLTKENIQLNRKVLSELSMHEPYSFKALVDISRNAFPGNKNVVLPPKKEGISIVL